LVKLSKPKIDELEIPFIEEYEISSGKEERIRLFASIAASAKPVPTDWLLATLRTKKKPLAKQSLPSMLMRYNYRAEHHVTTEGLKITFIFVREDEEESEQSED